jgi:SAM-dependent methyltransferase
MCCGIREDVQAFVLGATETFALRGPVYQFGARPEGTSDEVGPLNKCFSRTDYLVCQFDEGVQLGRLPFPDGAAQTVLWVGALGRTFDTEQAANQMRRIVAPGGALLICAPVEGPVREGGSGSCEVAACRVQRLLAPLQLTLLGWQGVDGLPHTVYGLGFKPPITGTILGGVSRFLERFQQRLEAAAGGKIGWWRRLKGLLALRHHNLRQSPGRRVDCRVQFAVHTSADRGLNDGLLKAWLLDEKTGGPPQGPVQKGRNSVS